MSAITYKPVSERIFGLATVKVGEKMAKITWHGDDDVSKKVALSDLPEYPVLKPNSEKDYYVVYNSTSGEVESIGPERGMFTGRCVDMSRPEKGADPEPIKSSPFKDGDHLSYYFKVWFKITKGAYKNVTVPMNLGYKLRRAPDGTATFTADPDNPKATAVRKLYEFLRVTGVLDGDVIMWDEETNNVLPEVLSRILAKKRDVDIVIKDGKIAQLLEPDMEDDEDESPFDDDNLDDVESILEKEKATEDDDL